jgi:hypothetical protein
VDPVPVQAQETTRAALHRIAAHVLGRRRFEVTGRFGLRASPGGFATPAFGDQAETIRVTGTCIVREQGGTSAYLALAGTTLRQLAVFAGTDVDTPFSCGSDTPAVGDPDSPLELDTASTRALADWYSLGCQVLDDVVGSLPRRAEPATIQLWPEHFDAGTHVGLPSGERVNLGVSPGDSSEPEPYLYVGPWSAERKGDPSFWNAPFGALLSAMDVLSTPDPGDTARAFLRAGIANASS